ncbi:MAG: helical backbone metal receptor [Myxococcota bacterium]|nr:helical backbone metal receptor [Myxococcota bacterium]
MRWLLLVFVLAACREEAPAPAQPAAQHRLVSLSPSATEVVAALGATPLLVGVDDYSKFPPEVEKLPKVGSFLTPNLEVIVSLRPTLVIVDDVHKPAAGALRDAGLQTIECPIHSLPDVKKALLSVGAKLGKSDDAKRVADQIESALDAAAAKRPAKRPRVLAILDREAGGLGNLVAAGPGSWLDELLAVTGGENVLAASGVRYPKISMEEVLRSKPDIILDASYAARASAKEWTTVDVPAVKSGRVVVIRDEYMIAPSPRVQQALDTMAKSIAMLAQ